MLSVEPNVKKDYVVNGQVRLVFAPVLNHADRSLQTHQAAECAADQGKFWEMHNLLFERQDNMWWGDIRSTVKTLAPELALDVTAFESCIDEQRTLERVQTQDLYRQNLGIRGQPVFNINGVWLIGSQPYETIRATIEEQLQAVQ